MKISMGMTTWTEHPVLIHDEQRPVRLDEYAQHFPVVIFIFNPLFRTPKSSSNYLANSYTLQNKSIFIFQGLESLFLSLLFIFVVKSERIMHHFHPLKWNRFSYFIISLGKTFKTCYFTSEQYERSDQKCY